jgi:hypothetical protein
MKSNLAVRISGAVLLAGFLAACSLPVSSTPTQISFPTPDQAQTLTAVFRIPPTSSAIPKATQQGAATSSSGTKAATTSTTLTATKTPTPANCTNLVKFVSETVPDYTYEAPGSTFIKTWTLQNIGTCTWGTGYALAFDHGDQMSGAATVPITTSVAPNATITVSVSLTTPTVGGTYTGFWKLQSPQNVKFGVGTGGANSFTVVITNSASAATSAYYPATTAVPVCNAKTQRPDANGGMVEVYSAAAAPTINSDLTDWDDPLVDSIDHHVFIKSGLSEGSDSATYTLKWDANFLYVAVHVVDNMFVQVTSGSGAEMYKGDSVEILLDTDLQGDYCDTSLNGDDYQLGLNPGDGTHAWAASGPGMFLWFPTARTGIISTTTTGSSAIASTTVAGGWIIEARISWGVFDLPAQTIVGRKFGFAISVSDNDVENTQVQERMLSNDKNRVLSNPTTWGTLELEGRTGP